MWAKQLLFGTVVVLALIATGCAGPVIKRVGQTDVEGAVIDRDTRQPVAGACVRETLSRGGFWTEPGEYLIGQACTDAAGHFRIPAAPRTVYNVAEPDSAPAFEVSAGGYRKALVIPATDALASGYLTLTLEQVGPVY